MPAVLTLCSWSVSCVHPMHVWDPRSRTLGCDLSGESSSSACCRRADANAPCTQGGHGSPRPLLDTASPRSVWLGGANPRLAKLSFHKKSKGAPGELNTRKRLKISTTTHCVKLVCTCPSSGHASELSEIALTKTRNHSIGSPTISLHCP